MKRRHIAAAATLVLLTACSGGNGPSSTGHNSPGSGSPSAVAFSACMRSHGVPNFPDPDVKGNPPVAGPRRLGVAPSRYQAAERACQGKLPTGGSLEQRAQQCVMFGDCPAALLRQVLSVEREYAACMRSHGVPHWPDPTIDRRGHPVFDLTAAGIPVQSTGSSPFEPTDRECRRLIGDSVPDLPTS